jgi:hypothetical protein
VQERLTKDELETRVARALAASTYADLDELIADIPIAPKLAPLSQLTPAHTPGRREVRRAVTTGAGAFTAAITALGVAGGIAGGKPLLGFAVAMAGLILAAITAGFAALVVRTAVMIERQVQRRRPPSRPEASGQEHRPPWPERRNGGDAALASALWTATRRPRSSTTAWTSSTACRSPAISRLAARCSTPW